MNKEKIKIFLAFCGALFLVIIAMYYNDNVFKSSPREETITHEKEPEVALREEEMIKNNIPQDKGIESIKKQNLKPEILSRYNSGIRDLQEKLYNSREAIALRNFQEEKEIELSEIQADGHITDYELKKMEVQNQSDHFLSESYLKSYNRVANQMWSSFYQELCSKYSGEDYNYCSSLFR